MTKKGEDINGWLIIDKPRDIGSTQVVNLTRRLFNAKKNGHAGTLDPFATGVLPIAFGEATKVLPYVTDGDKEYEFLLQFGASTNTDDSEGEIFGRRKIIPNFGLRKEDLMKRSESSSLKEEESLLLNFFEFISANGVICQYDGIDMKKVTARSLKTAALIFAYAVFFPNMFLAFFKFGKISYLLYFKSLQLFRKDTFEQIV